MIELTPSERTWARSLLAVTEPDEVASPRTAAECIDVLRSAASRRQAVVPWGGGTSVATGRPPRCYKWLALKTTGLAADPATAPDDSLVTCSAGTRWADLRRAVEGDGQYVAVDPPHEDHATVGGVVAAGSFGLLRSSCGGPRDAVVALSFVLASGELVRSGAAVVKNAAGYDLCRLLAGSWGTLGLITQVTFRTSPLPAAAADIQYVSHSSTDVSEVARRVVRSAVSARYIAVRLGERPSLLIGLAGSPKSVAWQRDVIAAEVAGSTLREDVSAEPGPYRDELAPPEAQASVRVWAPPSEVLPLSLRLAAHADSVVALPTVGVVCASLRPDAKGEVARRVQAVEGELAARHRTWLRLPPDLCATIDPWPAPGSIERMRAIKRALDPTGLLSPGRFVGGI